MKRTALGFDLSTQQLKVIAIDVDTLSTVREEAVTFDVDLPKYKTHKGVYVNGEEIYASVEMWIEALDLILDRMKAAGFDFSTVASISGAGQQHGSVYWNKDASNLLSSLDSTQTLSQQLTGAFSHPYSPNWQDHSTTEQCDAVEAEVGGAENLASITGSKAHHRFTGPQILRLRQLRPNVYANTARISLVSSFLASLFLGDIAPIDISDVCGMNLWNVLDRQWDQKLINLVAGGRENGSQLIKRLGNIELDGSKNLGNISSYFVKKYGFNDKAMVIPFTGDNPSTILSLPLRPLDCIVSLGTSTTLLMSTPVYKTSGAYHLFDHPTSPGNYMFMLCYKNGSLAREAVRDSISKTSSWDDFNKAISETSVLGRTETDSAVKMGVYFPLAEIVPNVDAGTWRYKIDEGKLEPSSWSTTFDARAIVESQAFSMRLRSEPMLQPSSVNQERRQPRRVYLVGGASQNPAIGSVLGQVLGGAEGVYRLDASQACALGSAHKAAWAAGRETADQSFEEFVGKRWDEAEKCERVSDGYCKGIWEEYGEMLPYFARVENMIME